MRLVGHVYDDDGQLAAGLLPVHGDADVVRVDQQPSCMTPSRLSMWTMYFSVALPTDVPPKLQPSSSTTARRSLTSKLWPSCIISFGCTARLRCSTYPGRQGSTSVAALEGRTSGSTRTPLMSPPIRSLCRLVCLWSWRQNWTKCAQREDSAVFRAPPSRWHFLGQPSQQGPRKPRRGSRHYRLIQAIVEADQDLDGHNKPLLRRLLVLTVLIKYLEDRRVFPDGWFSDSTPEPSRSSKCWRRTSPIKCSHFWRCSKRNSTATYSRCQETSRSAASTLRASRHW